MRTRRNLVTGMAAAALVLVPASGAALTASAGGQPVGRAWSVPGPAGRHARFVDQHGPVLPTPQLYLIYWGTAWMPQTAAAPTAAEVTGAVSTLMASGYLTGLTQYRGTGHGALRGSALITSSDPPDGFTDHQVAELIDAQLSAGTIPGPDPGNQTVYGVVMPAWVTPVTGSARRTQLLHTLRAEDPLRVVHQRRRPGQHHRDHLPRTGRIRHRSRRQRLPRRQPNLRRTRLVRDRRHLRINLGEHRRHHRPRGTGLTRTTPASPPATAGGIAAGSSGGTQAGHAAVSAGHAPASTWVTGQGDIAQVKRHITWMGGDPARAQRPQADPSWVTDQRDLAKVKRDVVLHAGQRARGR